MASRPVAVVFGAGARVGASVANTFASNGYNVATVSRSGTNTKNDKGILSLAANLAEPSSVPAVFDAIKAEFQAAPSVIVYNAAALTFPPKEGAVFSISEESFTADLNTNTVTPYVVAQQSVLGWESLPGDAKKSFIYTGNILNTKILPVPIMTTLGVGKSASAHWIGLADTLYSKLGQRFIYADQRTEAGQNVSSTDLDGDAHAQFYLQLANHDGDVPWHATFVKDKGYVKFE